MQRKGSQDWEGSTTVVRTVVSRNSMIQYTGGSTRLRLAKELALLCEPSVVTQVMGIFQPIIDEYFTSYVKSRNFAKRQCE